jgi:hypothetical protein
MIAKSSSGALSSDLQRASQKLEEHVSHATEILSASIIQASGIFKASPRTLASLTYSRAAVRGTEVGQERDGSARDWIRRMVPTLMIVFWFVAVAAIVASTGPASKGPSTADKTNPKLPAVSVHPPGVHSAEDLAALGRPGSL